MAQVVWTEKAKQDLGAIADYIALDKHTAAVKLVLGVFQATRRLEIFPESGRRLPELLDYPYREIFLNPCRVIYKYFPSDERVVILTIVRQERDLLRYVAEFEAELS